MQAYNQNYRGPVRPKQADLDRPWIRDQISRFLGRHVGHGRTMSLVDFSDKLERSISQAKRLRSGENELSLSQALQLMADNEEFAADVMALAGYGVYRLNGPQVSRHDLAKLSAELLSAHHAHNSDGRIDLEEVDWEYSHVRKMETAFKGFRAVSKETYLGSVWKVIQ